MLVGGAGGAIPQTSKPIPIPVRSASQPPSTYISYAHIIVKCNVRLTCRTTGNADSAAVYPSSRSLLKLLAPQERHDIRAVCEDLGHTSLRCKPVVWGDDGETVFRRCRGPVMRVACGMCELLI